MGNFFTELKRRHIYRVAAAYAVVAWVLVQVVNNLTPMLRLPDWIGAAIVVFLLVGFPVALIFAWILHLASPEGAEKAKSGATDWLLMGALAAVFALISYEQVGLTRNNAAQQATVAAAQTAAASPKTAISIAVLPFANMSGDAAQEFFSDGMTEEITSALAKVPDLRVVARTSAFEFKGKNIDIKTMGGQLGATHLIEGSVRKAGNRLRITAQLIKADDGTHVWAEDYDRELTDVFAIQEDIARAITLSLNMSLGLKPGDTFVRSTQNVGTYQDYLRAKAWYRDRNSQRSGPFLKTLESVVERDPGFAPAWAELSKVYAQQTNVDPVVLLGTIEAARSIVEKNQSKAEAAARKAIELNPRDPGGYAALAFVQRQRGEWLAAIDSIHQGLALDPNDPDVLGSYGNVLLRVGNVKDALRIEEELRTLEPLVPVYDIETALLLHAAGQNREAIALLEAIPEGPGFFFRDVYLAYTYAAEGRYEDAAGALLRVASRVPVPEIVRDLENAAHVLRSASAAGSEPRSLPSLGRFENNLNFVYLYVGAYDRFMDYPDREAQLHFAVDAAKSIWTPKAAPVRKMERFKTYARKIGLIDYWRTKGWPDLCHPTTGDDFECE